MSGTRDYRSLVNSSRMATGPMLAGVGTDEDKQKLALRLLNGVQSNKYKPVDYEQLKLKAQEMKFKGNNSLVKIKQIEQASKNTKEQSMLKQHKAVWMKELSHLNSLRKRNTADVDLHTRHALEMEDVGHIYDDFEAYGSRLSVEFAEFKQGTVDPIWELRDDLQYWISQMAAQRGVNPDNAGEDLGSPDEIMETILSVQGQQKKVLERLHNEQLSCEQDLSKGILGEIADQQTEVRHPPTGIPNEALQLHCPNDELKMSVLEEFIIIDQKYTDRIDNLDEIYADVICIENGGWDKDDHFQFQAILDQHSFDLHNRRTIYMDRLKKQFPNKTRADLVAHEDWVIRARNFHRQKRSLVNDWYRDRKELLEKAKAVFYEAQAEYELQVAQAERSQQQQELCNILYDKVKSWREERMEIMLIRQKLLQEEMRIAEEERLAQEEKVKQRRKKEKEKIKQRHEVLEEQRRKQAEVDKIRLEELQKRQAAQAIVDAERVKHREQLEQQKIQAQHKKAEEQRQQEYEKECRLEALREKVRVVAEVDPYRVIKDTENWQHRRMPAPADGVNMHQPLFDIHTFNSGQISSDPRLKLETKLRDAGLHNTDYARHVMARVEPPKPPRKDTFHTLKLGD